MNSRSTGKFAIREKHESARITCKNFGVVSVDRDRLLRGIQMCLFSLFVGARATRDAAEIAVLAEGKLIFAAAQRRVDSAFTGVARRASEIQRDKCDVHYTLEKEGHIGRGGRIANCIQVPLR